MSTDEMVSVDFLSVLPFWSISIQRSDLKSYRLDESHIFYAFVRFVFDLKSSCPNFCCWYFFPCSRAVQLRASVHNLSYLNYQFFV